MRNQLLKSKCLTARGRAVWGRRSAKKQQRGGAPPRPCPGFLESLGATRPRGVHQHDNKGQS